MRCRRLTEAGRESRINKPEALWVRFLFKWIRLVKARELRRAKESSEPFRSTHAAWKSRNLSLNVAWEERTANGMSEEVEARDERAYTREGKGQERWHGAQAKRGKERAGVDVVNSDDAEMGGASGGSGDNNDGGDPLSFSFTKSVVHADGGGSDASAAQANNDDASDDGHLEVGAETSKVDDGAGGLARTRRLDTVLALRPIARSAFLVHVDDRDSQTTRRDHARRARGDG